MSQVLITPIAGKCQQTLSSERQLPRVRFETPNRVLCLLEALEHILTDRLPLSFTH